MTLSRSFCDSRASEAATAAAGASLSNVRDRELRSEAAWRAMSDRILEMEKAREAKEVEQRTAREVVEDAEAVEAELSSLA